MIRNFKHKGLRRLYEEGSTKGVEAAYVNKISLILAALDAASVPEHMNAPGFKLHSLTGDRKSFWSVTVSANWRIIFRFDETDICDVDLIDYH